MSVKRRIVTDFAKKTRFCQKRYLTSPNFAFIISATSRDAVRRFWSNLPQPFDVGGVLRRRVAAFAFACFSFLRGRESRRGGRPRRVLYFRRFFLSFGRRRTRRLGGAPEISVKSAKSPSATRGKGAFFGRFRRVGGLPKRRFSSIITKISERFPPLGRRNGPSPFCVRRSVVEETRPRAKSSSIF